MTNGTTFEEIYKIFLSKVQDWQQKRLFLQNESVATALCESYLMKAIAKFTNCELSINSDIAAFNQSLSVKEKDIISSLMVEAWMDRIILDVTQMNLTLNDNDWAKVIVWYNWKLLYFKPSNCWKSLRDKYTTT